MTEKEAILKLIRYRNRKIKESGWWIFNKRKIAIKKTKLLQPYERDVNLPLPESLVIEKALFDKTGITTNSEFYPWKEILVTAILTEFISYYDHKVHNDQLKPDETLLIYLTNNTIIEVHLGDTRHLFDQLGHFIEQYKQIADNL